VSYEIELTRRAEKEILKLDTAIFEQIRAAIDGLGENPRPPGVRKLRGRESEWRIRVGRLRILYTIQDTTRRILVHRVTDRKDVYRR
jgi:mRNA interferase RelE/StbE